MTQISENRNLSSVFTDLLSPEGSEIYLKPVEEYVRPGVRLGFGTVIESARRQGQVAFGYRVQTKATDPDFGIVLNPDKTERIRFAPDDKVIVLAEE